MNEVSLVGQQISQTETTVYGAGKVETNNFEEKVPAPSVACQARITTDLTSATVASLATHRARRGTGLGHDQEGEVIVERAGPVKNAMVNQIEGHSPVITGSKGHVIWQPSLLRSRLLF